MSGTIESKGVGTTTAPLGAPRIEASNGRATPKGASFSTYLGQARPVLKQAEAVASVLPGGPLLAAAVRAPQALASGAPSGVGSGVGGGAPIVPRSGAAPITGGAGATGTTGATGAAAGGEANGIESVLADSQAFNLYYLQLQEQISAENRQYSTLSNVLKARHDTVKNAIGNIR
jgi:hypothetical protein